VLEPLEVLGVGHRTGVESLLVADPAGLDVLDVVVGLALGAGQVVDPDLQVRGPFLQPGGGGSQLRELGALRRVGGLVAQRVEPAVELLDVEELQLGERVGFQGGLLVLDVARAWPRRRDRLVVRGCGLRPGRSRGPSRSC
jgi:hypothetical protein